MVIQSVMLSPCGGHKAVWDNEETPRSPMPWNPRPPTPRSPAPGNSPGSTNMNGKHARLTDTGEAGDTMQNPMSQPS